MGGCMKIFQLVMYGFYAVLFLAVTGVGAWFYRKRKEGDR